MAAQPSDQHPQSAGRVEYRTGGCERLIVDRLIAPPITPAELRAVLDALQDELHQLI
ncbi:hypothetical protein QLH51_10945 [Sphingomonas sp. 2R-10]|uniref:hypothetical protein n=1 Tax=Sphingomonas sp. 2R-10 TaxID=3045148 RepID=UPI0013DDDC86|nr:hypothetical protein [Sphingomonas sp. 2R-10]MDJ0277310.1 hypothetical protein [Sphingomonas sp. 2R-10]